MAELNAVTRWVDFELVDGPRAGWIGLPVDEEGRPPLFVHVALTPPLVSRLARFQPEVDPPVETGPAFEQAAVYERERWAGYAGGGERWLYRHKVV